MNLVINKDIRIFNCSKQIEDWAEEHLVLPNPEYHKKERMGFWVGNTPKEIRLYVRDGNDLIVPFGCLRDLWDLIHNKSIFVPKIEPIRHINYESNIIPYIYQEKAIHQALKAKNGVLVMPCGSGKTQAGLEIVARVGGKALWLTHTQDLLNQSKTRAENVFDCDRSMFGTITSGKVNIGNGITFATVQTMCKIDLQKYENCWDIIIVDECQHCCGSPTKVTQFYKVISSLSARYKIGLTATPKRADGLHKSMFALLGKVIHEVTREEVKETTCDVVVKMIDTGHIPDYKAVLCGDGTLDYTALINDLISNEERKQLIQRVINGLDGSCLVLANRVSYIEDLQKGFNKKSICLSTLGTNKTAKAQRKNALTKLNNGEIDAVFATYQLAKEGLDVPSLKYVVFATPEKDETTVIQSAGRVGRKADGKKHGTVIDFCDEFGMYKGWAKKRKGYYKKIDAKMV